MEKAITQEKLAELVEKLTQDYDVYAPVVNGKFSEFLPIKHLNECNLDIINTTKPLKQLFLPQTEKLFSVIGEGENLSLKSCSPISRKRIILGAKSCDVKGVELLANVYGKGPCIDELFLDRKKNTIIIGLTCNQPRDTCFCRALDINPIEEDGMDVVLTKINDKYIVKSKTTEGENILNKYNDIFTEVAGSDDELKKKIMEAILKKQNKVLDIKKIKSILDIGFEHPVWDEESQRCITCGICTYLCPTCQCFDIHDECSHECKPVRFRTWDTCMSPDFTLMAGGHNPRAKKKNRFRQRFMHKFKYYIDHYNIPYCTGCGRCIQACPVNVDIFELLNKIVNRKTFECKM